MTANESSVSDTSKGIWYVCWKSAFYTWRIR